MVVPTNKQLEVINHTGSHARVIAGPGSGKSRTLILHILSILKKGNENPKSILILAFNRSIAEKLKKDLVKHLGENESDYPVIMTLHSYALKLLKRFSISAEIGNATFPSGNEMLIVNKVISRYLKQKKCTYRGKNINSSVVERILYPLYAKHYWFGVKAIKTENESILKQFEEAINFTKIFFGIRFLGELPSELRKLIAKEPESRKYYKKIIIDEYQDLNLEDIELIKLVAQKESEVIIAGDDDQSICSYRGANSQGLKLFAAEYPKVSLFELDECFRCSQKVFKYGQEVVAQIPNDERIEKEIKCSTNLEGLVVNWVFKTPKSQRQWIVDVVKKYTNTDKNASVLIIVPINKLLKDYVDQLKGAGVEVEDLSTLKTGENLRKFWLMLRAMINPSDQLATQGLIEARVERWDKIFEKLLDKLNWLKYRQTLSKALDEKRAELETSFREENKQALFEVFLIKDEIKRYQKNNIFDVSKVKDSLFSVSDFCSEFFDEFDADQVTPIINEVVDKIDELQIEIKEPFEILSFFLPIIEEKPSPNPKIKVEVTTLRKAKGLEADLVIVPDLEDNILPGQSELSEAKRLLYVAVTRAKRALIISSVKTRIGGYSAGDQSIFKKPSRLLPSSIISETGETEAEKIVSNINILTEVK